MGALVSFLGGSAFRMIWGEVSSYFSKRQDHKMEQQRMLLQGKLDGEQHARNLESLRLQSELGVKEIRVKSEADLAQIDAETFRDAVSRAQAPTGIKIVDALNALVRPAYAFTALVLWIGSEISSGRLLIAKGALWAPTAFGLELIGAVAGFYFADRSMRKAGK